MLFLSRNCLPATIYIVNKSGQDQRREFGKMFFSSEYEDWPITYKPSRRRAEPMFMGGFQCKLIEWLGVPDSVAIFPSAQSGIDALGASAP